MAHKAPNARTSTPELRNSTTLGEPAATPEPRNSTTLGELAVVRLPQILGHSVALGQVERNLDVVCGGPGPALLLPGGVREDGLASGIDEQ